MKYRYRYVWKDSKSIWFNCPIKPKEQLMNILKSNCIGTWNGSIIEWKEIKEFKSIEFKNKKEEI